MGKRRKRIREDKETPELNLPIQKQICVRCCKREIYQNIKTMDWCEACIWEFVRNDPEQAETQSATSPTSQQQPKILVRE